MISISKVYSFDSAHKLWRDDWPEDWNVAVFGKCAREHGHTYSLDVTVVGDVDPETGMILNYFVLDDIVKPYVDGYLDHRNLNVQFPSMLTTAENLVHAIAIAITDLFQADRRTRDVSLEQIMLQETSKTSAVWFA